MLFPRICSTKYCSYDFISYYHSAAHERKIAPATSVRIPQNLLFYLRKQKKVLTEPMEINVIRAGREVEAQPQFSILAKAIQKSKP